MKPTIGRIVHYAAHDARVHYAAIITHVWSETCVNLFVFGKGSSDDLAATGIKTSVVANEPPEPFSWHWPERE